MVGCRESRSTHPEQSLPGLRVASPGPRGVHPGVGGRQPLLLPVGSRALSGGPLVSVCLEFPAPVVTLSKGPLDAVVLHGYRAGHLMAGVRGVPSACPPTRFLRLPVGAVLTRADCHKLSSPIRVSTIAHKHKHYSPGLSLCSANLGKLISWCTVCRLRKWDTLALTGMCT